MGVGVGGKAFTKPFLILAVVVQGRGKTSRAFQLERMYLLEEGKQEPLGPGDLQVGACETPARRQGSLTPSTSR